MLRKISFTVLCLVVTGLFAQSQPYKVRVTGEGTPLIFLPGFSCPGEVWDETVEALSDSYECHVFTFAGFGSVAPVGFPWLPQLKEGLESYIRDRELRDVAIIGHSMGGTLALWLAAEGHADVSRLILVDALPAAGALMIPDYDPTALAYDSPWNQQMLEMDEQAFSAMAGQMAAGMASKDQDQRQIADWIVASDRETYVYGFTDLLKLDLREALSQIQIPVDILAATRPFGKEVAGTTYKEQYQALTEYSLTFAEDSSHFIQLDQPEFFLAYLEGLLSVQK